MNARERIFLAAAELRATEQEARRQQTVSQLRVSTEFLLACEALVAELGSLQGLSMRNAPRGAPLELYREKPLEVLLKFADEDPVTISRQPYVSVGFDGGPMIVARPVDDGDRVLFYCGPRRLTVSSVVDHVTSTFAPFLVT